MYSFTAVGLKHGELNQQGNGEFVRAPKWHDVDTPAPQDADLATLRLFAGSPSCTVGEGCCARLSSPSCVQRVCFHPRLAQSHVQVVHVLRR